MAGRRRISQGGATQEILRGVCPEIVEGLKVTCPALPVVVASSRIARFRFTFVIFQVNLNQYE
jgi:hypothetical protein